MPPGLPDVLSRLLTAGEGEKKEEAWERFMAEYSRLVHSVARRSSPDYDTLMDRYSYVFDGLREDDFKRLRGFDPDGPSKFSTWLVVVASRLCIDWHRSRYGRGGGENEASPRRRLADLVAEEVAVERIPDGARASPEGEVRNRELHEALAASLRGLSSEDRLLLRLRFEDRRPVAEIARTLGLSSEFAGYRRLKRLLTTLRRELEGRGFDGPWP